MEHFLELTLSWLLTEGYLTGRLTLGNGTGSSYFWKWEKNPWKVWNLTATRQTYSRSGLTVDGNYWYVCVDGHRDWGRTEMDGKHRGGFCRQQQPDFMKRNSEKPFLPAVGVWRRHLHCHCGTLSYWSSNMLYILSFTFIMASSVFCRSEIDNGSCASGRNSLASNKSSRRKYDSISIIISGIYRVAKGWISKSMMYTVKQFS